MTTNLPAVATIEAEALEYAKGRLIEFRDNSAQWLGPVGPGHSFLNPEAGHAMVRFVHGSLACPRPLLDLRPAQDLFPNVEASVGRTHAYPQFRTPHPILSIHSMADSLTVYCW